MMKTLTVAVTLALLVPAAAYAQHRGPQNPPYDAWCRDQPLDRGTVQVCSAYTYQQCMASRASHTESCYPNPRYDPRYRRN